MTQTTEALKTEFKKSKELLGTLRDEIRVKLHLAGMDARTAWKELNAEAERASREISQTSHAAVAEIISRLKNFSASLDQKLAGKQDKTAPAEEETDSSDTGRTLH